MLPEAWWTTTVVESPLALYAVPFTSRSDVHSVIVLWYVVATMVVWLGWSYIHSQGSWNALLPALQAISLAVWIDKECAKPHIGGRKFVKDGVRTVCQEMGVNL